MAGNTEIERLTNILLGLHYCLIADGREFKVANGKVKGEN